MTRALPLREPRRIVAELVPHDRIKPSKRHFGQKNRYFQVLNEHFHLVRGHFYLVGGDFQGIDQHFYFLSSRVVA
jgi:hypothetical protein